MDQHDAELAEKLLLHQTRHQNAGHDVLIWEAWSSVLMLSLRAWYEEHGPHLLRWCKHVERKFRLSDVAHDLFQDSYLVAARYALQFDPAKGEFDKFIMTYTWLYVKREDVINRYIRNRGCGGETSIGCDNLVSPEEKLTTGEDDSALSMIEALPEIEQTYIKLKFIGEMNNCEMGRLLGVSECTVRYQIRRILDKLVVSGDGNAA